MDEVKPWRTWLMATLLVAAVLGWMLAHTKPAHAADKGGLGGDCCSDLEQRVAELEATTARKGNRKVSLRVYGVINEAIMHVDGDGIGGKWAVGENSNIESFIGVAGEAVILPHWKAGYVLEIGIGGAGTLTGSNPLSSPFVNDTHSTYVQRSFGYVKSDQLGQVSLGLNDQATHDITEISTANTVVAARMLSLRPLIGPQIGEALDIYDGGRTDEIRYDSPEFMGAHISASWATGGVSIGPFSVNTGDVWDVALRWAGEGNGFQAAAGLGYREGIVIPTVGNLGSISVGPGLDPKTISGSASIKHIATGIFVNFAAGDIDLGTKFKNDDAFSWATQAGIENKWIALGKTTIFGEYADSTDLNLKYMGGGVVQRIDAAGDMDIYGSFRHYDLSSAGGDLFMGGVKVGF